MSLFRSGLAMIAGAVFTAVVMFCAAAITSDLAAAFPLLHFALAFPYGICGGLLAGRLAAGKEIMAGAGAAVLLTAAGMVSYLANSGGQGTWLWVAMTASLAGGEIFGAHLRAMQVAKRRRFEKRKNKQAHPATKQRS